MAVLVLGVCHHSPFLPFWLRRRAPLCSKLRSWPIAMFQKILTGRTIYSCGRHPEMRRQTPSLGKSLLGTVPVLRRTGRQSSRVSLRHFSEQHLTLLDCVTVWTGCWPCQLLHVAWSLMTRQSESQLEPGWLWNFVFLISAAVGQNLFGCHSLYFCLYTSTRQKVHHHLNGVSKIPCLSWHPGVQGTIGP